MATYEDLIKQGYQGSATVKKYQTQLDNALTQKPADYSSAYTDKLNNLYNQITTRGPFQYNLNGDMLYNQYKTQYQNMGQRAMRDTMGQAAALTGGYGNTYAQNVGQQAYNQYLTALNDKIPELYQLARSNYDADTNALYQQYSMTKDLDDTDYSRWADKLASWRDDVNLYNSLFQNERTFDYGLWNDNIAYLMKLAEMAAAGSGRGGGGGRTPKKEEETKKETAADRAAAQGYGTKKPTLTLPGFNDAPTQRELTKRLSHK